MGMKYVLGVFAVVVLIILAVILVFRGGGEDAPQNQAGEKTLQLSEYADKPATAVLTIEGKVVGDEARRAIRISVSRTERVFEVLSGYEENITQRETFTNNEAAYETFIHALDKAGFSRERESAIQDERGTCPLGKRYIYELQDGSEEVLRRWSTNCSRARGTYGGSASVTREIFENQIPDYRRLVRTVEL
jgi:hypothetical protein